MTDNNLILLISQPRSGSTLTQKILGTHSKIYTRSEPWLLLNQLSQFKQDGSYAKYNKTLENIGVDNFISELPNGKEDYLNGLRKMYLSLYNNYLRKEDKTYFLDKTPRYYLITNELKELFPDAKFIFLKRNPLAVLSSIINTWNNDNWYNLSNYRTDLIDAIDAMIEASQSEKTCTILYENLLSDPKNTLQDIFNHIGIGFEEEVLRYHQNKSEKWRFGDQKNVYEKSGIDSKNTLKWTKNLNNPQYWRIMHDYLQYIGKEKFEKYGYSFKENLEILNKNIPIKSLLKLEKQTIPLSSYLDHEKNIIIQLSNTKKQLTEKHNLIIQKNKLLKTKEGYIANLANLRDIQIEKIQNLESENTLLLEQLDIIRKEKSKIVKLANEHWCRFGRLSRKRKLWSIGKIISKKLKIYGLLQPIAKHVTNILKKSK